MVGGNVMMNGVYRIFSVLTVLSVIISCVDEPAFEGFEPEFGEISEFGPDGGQGTIGIKSDSPWVATVQDPWVTVSPANGKGSVQCQVMIDSALTVEPRSTKIYVDNLVTGETLEYEIRQQGYEKMIKVDKPEVNIESYDVYDKRYFEVQVEANVPFRLELDEDTKKWIEPKDLEDNLEPELKLDRGMRPRKVKVKFAWKINSTENQREAFIDMNPVDQTVVLEEKNKDRIKLTQRAPEYIPERSVEGDSLALIAINRALGCWSGYELNDRMADWEGVTVWKASETTDPDKVGRVKSASFYMFGTKESLPFQVRYLTEAEELSFFGNTNTFLLNLDAGEEICQLENLKKLTISAYGLSSLPDNFKNLKNLRYLDLSSNNFQELPEVLTKENFPNLTALMLNACQRHTISNLQATKKENFGGFTATFDTDASGKKYFPSRLLSWDTLDTLRLSVNYFEGEFPDLTDDDSWPKWTPEEVHACDTLPDVLIGLPKVLPNAIYFAINHNRMYGQLPDWLLFHPKLDWWAPQVLFFPQEGVATDGTIAGFDNEPVNMDYYYKHYTKKKLNPANTSKNDPEEDE